MDLSMAPQPHPSDYSTGSFVPTILVLSIIAILSVISCIIGRLCLNRDLEEDEDTDIESGLHFSRMQAPSTRMMTIEDDLKVSSSDSESEYKESAIEGHIVIICDSESEQEEAKMDHDVLGLGDLPKLFDLDGLQVYPKVASSVNSESEFEDVEGCVEEPSEDDETTDDEDE